MPIKHAFTSAKADGDDATLIRPSDWNADHDLEGLPSQWTVGANGNVTATTSDNSSPLSLVAPNEGGPGYDQAYALMIAPESLAWQGAIYISVGDQANLTANAYIIRAINETTGRQVFDIDSWGSMSLSADVEGGGGFDVKAGNDQNVLNVVADVDLDESRVDINSLLRVSRGFILDVQAPPADAALSPGDVALWFDDTNGAAKLKIKGKSANGTVVTGEVALT